MNKYYEIISTRWAGGLVIGACIQPEDCDEEGIVFGRISKKNFERFMDNGWEKPISKKQYKLVPQPKKLVRTKPVWTK